MNKKAKKITSAGVQAAVLVLVIVIVLFAVYAEMVPEAQSAGDSMNDSNQCSDAGCFWNYTADDCYADNITSEASCTTTDSIPLASLFGGAGVVFVVLMAMLLVVVIAGLLISSKK